MTDKAPPGAADAPPKSPMPQERAAAAARRLPGLGFQRIVPMPTPQQMDREIFDGPFGGPPPGACPTETDK